MSIYGISTKFTESIRFVTTVHSIILFSDRNGSKWAVESSRFTEFAEEFRMTEIDASWGGRGAWWGGVEQATARQCMAGQGWVG